MFTYYLKEKLMTRRERRKDAEKKAAKSSQPYKYPTIEELRAEDEQTPPTVSLIVRDDTGAIVRRIPASRKKGVHRAAWNLRYPASTPVQLARPANLPPWVQPPSGPLALPGTYTVALEKQVDGETTPLTDPQSFEVVPLELATFAAKDRDVVLAFQKKVARLQRAVLGAQRAAGEARNRLKHIRRAIVETPSAEPALLTEAQGLQERLRKLVTRLSGDATLRRQQEPVPTSISQRVGRIVGSQWSVTSPPTQTQSEGYSYAATEFADVLAKLRTLMTEDLIALENKLEQIGAPWTPGRIPEWSPETDE